jgi:hypothetical protein
MMDELRDYRFYAEDMLHISPVAIDYIFERFSKVMISKESMGIFKKVMKVRKAFEHRPVNPTTAEFKEFIRQNLLQISQLTSQFPNLDFSQEQTYFEAKLAAF